MLGDVSGDGNMDVVIGSQGAQVAGLVWYQYPTWERHAVASGEFTTDGQLADIDGDGDLDIVISSLGEKEGKIVWFENDSGSDPREWIPHVVGSAYGHDVVVGDMNADGKMDIVTCDKKEVVLWTQVSLDVFKGHIIIERQGEGIALEDMDEDRDLDIVFGGSWLENAGTGAQGWTRYPIAPKWSPDTRVAIADMNDDGLPDVVLSVSEGKGGISWFESPKDPRTDPWAEHSIEKGGLDGAHSLQVADIDGDGDFDIVTAEMHTSWKRRVLVYFNKGGSFEPAVLARTGSHNMRSADIDNDGDIDILGKNYAGRGRAIEMWENLSSAEGSWEYVSVDQRRPKSQRGKMGTTFGDADGDGFADIVAGSFLYLNPKGNMQQPWKRIELPGNIDGFFAIDVNGNNLFDLVGIDGDTVQWIEAESDQLASWRTIAVGRVEKGRTQGYSTASLIPGKKPQLIFTRGKRLYVLQVPEDPERGLWPLHAISTENEEEGVGVGDIDGDGDLDIAAVRADGQQFIWFENPGSLAGKWRMHVAGRLIDPSRTFLDRIALADLNSDGKLDIIATEERQDWELAAHLYWFESPADSTKTGEWKRHIIGRHRSLNSMDTADIDGDGAIDIVAAEHTDQKEEAADDNLTLVYLNRNRGRNWIPHVVERGPHSSHLGARLVDLNNDGVLEIVSMGWSQYQFVHLWKKANPGNGG
ncbi:MAG: VCBS repeat-containing protein [Nitrospirota bacterium]